ncbi:MAG: SUMF1/EgtB/PvdO family nonheme iron enzyme, partial [Bryobacteraceae bacterium]
LRRVFSAVAEVHAGGGHVRDSSPERIGIADDGTVELDWVRDDESMSGTTIAASDPQYSAPESFADSGLQTPNARQLRDIYVLGMVATEMLLGRREFGRQFHGVVAEAAVGWMRWHLDPSSVAPSLTAGGADIPAGLSQAVAGMLAKDPARRPQSLAPVIAEMDRVVDRLDQTVPQTMQTREVVMPAPLPEPASRFPRWAAALLALAPLAGLAGAAWWFYPSLRALIPRAAEPVARAPEKEPENQVSTSAEKKDEGKPEATPQLGQDQQRGEPMTVDPRFPKSLFFPSGDMMLIAPAAEGPGEPYYLDRYEVTNAAYRAFCQETKHKFPAPPDWERDYANKDSHPVLNVSWNDAAAFAAWAGKRIPTEQEWEHAARGPDRMQFPWGNTMNETGANLAGPDEHPFAAPAGSMFYDLSPFGVADMLGNASEWVSGDAPAGFHVMKGSNFTVAPADAGLTRRVPVPDAGGGFVPVGFRCAMDAAKAVPEKAPAGAEAKK